MTPDDLGLLVDRLLDDVLSPDERAAFAAQLADDPLLRQQLADELSLALRIRASLADDAEQRADLLMATLSGSRRLALERRINLQLDATRDPPRRWLPWVSAAAAALVMAVMGGWWLGHDHSRGTHSTLVKTRGHSQPEPSFVDVRDDRNAPLPVVVDLTPGPSESPAPVTAADGVATKPIVDPPAPDAPKTATAPDNRVVSNEPAPGDNVAAIPEPQAPPTGPRPLAKSADRAMDRAVAANLPPPINATLTKPGTPSPTTRAQRLIPPLVINGSARLRRQGHESAIDASMRLVPGDEILVDGEGAELSNDRGVTWWGGPGTRLSIPTPRPTDVLRQPVHLTTGTLHVTAGQNLRPLITTPHIRIDIEDAELWITVTAAWTRIETVNGSVRLGASVVRPLAAGSYAVVLPGLPPAIRPAAQSRLEVIAGRFARDGAAVVPRILRGVPVAIADDAGATAVLAPLGDGIWLDQAVAHGLLAIAELPSTPPSARILNRAALTAWLADGDTRGATALRRADPLRPIHLAGPLPTRQPSWATSSELAREADAGIGRAMLAMVTVDDGVRANTWDALVRGAQGVIWTVSDHHDPGTVLRPLSAALDATTSLLTDGTRTRLYLGASSGSDVSAARWDCLGRRLIVVVNRSAESRPVAITQTRDLHPLVEDASIIMTQTDDTTSAQLPPGAAQRPYARP